MQTCSANWLPKPPKTSPCSQFRSFLNSAVEVKWLVALNLFLRFLAGKKRIWESQLNMEICSYFTQMRFKMLITSGSGTTCALRPVFWCLASHLYSPIFLVQSSCSDPGKLHHIPLPCVFLRFLNFWCSFLYHCVPPIAPLKLICNSLIGGITFILLL